MSDTDDMPPLVGDQATQEKAEASKSDEKAADKHETGEEEEHEKKIATKELADDGLGPGVCRILRCVYRKKWPTLTLRELEGCSAYEGSILFVGVPGASLTGVLTAGYLSETLNLKLSAFVTSKKLSPKTVVDGSQPAPPIRFLGDAHKKIMVVQSEAKLTGPLCHDFVLSVLDFAHRHKLSNVVVAEGIPVERYKIPGQPKSGLSLMENGADDDDKKDKDKEADEKKDDPNAVRFLTSNKALALTLDKEEHTLPISSAVIGGCAGQLMASGVMADVVEDTKNGDEFSWFTFLKAAGVPDDAILHTVDLLTKAGVDESLLDDLDREILADCGISTPGHQLKILKHAKRLALEGEKRKASRFDVTCLLAPCSARFPDARSAVAIVKLMDKYLLPHCPISVAKLEEKAELIEKKVKQAIKEASGQVLGRQGRTSDSHRMMYG